MSKFLSGHPSSILNSRPSTSNERQQKEKVQVEALYELGLLGSSGSASRRRGKDKDKEPPGGARLTGPIIRTDKYANHGQSRASPSKPSSAVKNSDLQNSQRAGEQRHRLGGGMAGMLDSDRSRSRRERTFVGSECAVCEEPLEHTLRGERILQFSCGHVSHEACFYEYIKEFESQYCPTCNAPLGLDTSRGGNVLDIGKKFNAGSFPIPYKPADIQPFDIEKLSSIVRSVNASDQSTRSQQTPTPTHWDHQTARPPSRESAARSAPQRDSSRDTRNSHNEAGSRDSRDSRERAERYGPSSRASHSRNDSEVTGPPSSVGYPETSTSGPPRRHDYDVQAMETNLTSPRASVTKNPIPSPSVSVRSEFPTLNRSRQQQTLTCLVTIEVPDSKWQPDPDDLRGAAPAPTTRPEESFARPPSPAQSAPRFYPYESPEVLEQITENLRNRVDNWHGLDFDRFGKLRLYGTIRVGKDKQSWQELECFLFAEMLICVKEKKISASQWEDPTVPKRLTRCTLKGSILIKKHLNEVSESISNKSMPGQTERITAANLRTTEDHILTLSLSVVELPSFHLRFDNRNQLKLWQQALLDLNAVEGSPTRSPDYDLSEPEEEDWHPGPNPQRVSSANSSSYGPARSATTAPTEYTNFTRNMRLPTAIHVPIDIVVVIPISSSMQGVKISLVRDALKFMVQNIGERDRMGLVTFGSSGGAAPLVGMTSRTWAGWHNVLTSIRPVGQKSHRSDVIDGANVAMDLLMQRKSNNPIATILLISDSSTSDSESVDFVVSRAEAAKIAIHSFGLGMTHKPDTMIELSTRTKASYTYVKDWMMLRECLAGCLGALQTMSHQNVKLKLKLPEGSPAKFVKISGALQITKRATGKDAEAYLGDLRFGDKRDILVQLVIAPDNASQEQLPQDPWETIVSGLEALGGPLDQEDQRAVSIEEVPLIQADLTWGDILRDGTVTHLPRPSLLAITMLPAPTNQKKSAWPNTPPIPPHPNVVQRRMELLTSDMLTRALTLVSRGQHDRAQHLLNETRSILKGLGKGGLPPIPPPQQKSPNPASVSEDSSPTSTIVPERRRTPSPTSATSSQAPQIPRHQSSDALSVGSSTGIDANTVSALDAELEASLEWINHPAVFGRDSRKAVLQAIGVISSQRGYTFRTPVESLWASRVSGVKKLTERSREWREDGGGEGGITEES